MGDTGAAREMAERERARDRGYGRWRALADQGWLMVTAAITTERPDRQTGRRSCRRGSPGGVEHPPGTCRSASAESATSRKNQHGGRRRCPASAAPLRR